MAVLALAALMPRAALAHPHEWIDMRSAPVFDAAGHVVALHQEWLFDDYYGQLSLPDFDANGNKVLDHDELMTLARENLANLKDYDYFTEVTVNGAKTAFAGVGDIDSRLEKGRVFLSFTLNLGKGIDPRGSSVSYRIFDPSYYIAMLHQKTEPVRIDRAGCDYAINRPKPDAVWVTLAQGLDRNATAPDDLGRNFAETVTVTCR